MNDTLANLLQPLAKGVITSILVLSAIGCATVVEQPVRQYAQPSDSDAVVYFFRSHQVFGVLSVFNIYEGEKKIGALKDSSYFFHRATPGTHTYRATQWGETTITVDLKANNVYYIKAYPSPSSGKALMLEIPSDEGAREVQQYTYVTSD
jgi:hypothetical protein